MSSRSKKLVGKQKRLITTRLMQISLLVDDYLYKQAPIHKRSCEAYIKEISSYQAKCSGDVRSLQVIEKLTRCMKAIIAEEQESDEWAIDELPFEDTSKNDDRDLSPVYSFEDEGLTQSPLADNILAQTCEESSSNSDAIESSYLTRPGETEDPLVDNGVRGHHDKDKLVIDLCNDETQVIDLRNDDIEEIIDVKDDKVHQKNKNRQNTSITTEFNIHNAISSLSIQNIEDVSMIIPFTQEYSQSILNNFDPLSNEAIQTGLNTSLTQDYEDVIRAASIQPKAFKDTSYKNKLINTVILPKHKVSQAPLIHTGTVSNVNVHKKVHAGNKPLAKKKTKRIEPTHTSETIVNVNSNKKKSAKFKNKKLEGPKRNVKATTKNNKQAIEPVPVHSSDEYNIKTKSNFKKNQGTNNIYHSTYGQNMPSPIDTTANTKVIINNKTINENLSNIYNENIVDDLLWIENIRFVREVSADEYVSITNDQHFWENCTLPACYNEADFN